MLKYPMLNWLLFILQNYWYEKILNNNELLLGTSGKFLRKTMDMWSKVEAAASHLVGVAESEKAEIGTNVWPEKLKVRYTMCSVGKFIFWGNVLVFRSVWAFLVVLSVWAKWRWRFVVFEVFFSKTKALLKDEVCSTWPDWENVSFSDLGLITDRPEGPK